MLGQVEQEVLRAFGIKQEVFFFDLDLDALLLQPVTPRRFVSLPKFPSVNWDMAIVVPEQVEAGRMVEAIYQSNEPLVERAEIFDIYRGKPMQEGYKSVAIAITYRSNQQTLDDQTVEKVHQRLLATILVRFHGRLREAAGQP
jgi:phenylalanyl-tRNA synthetase beta chain